MEEISPEEQQVVDAVLNLWQEKPATEALGSAKLLALIKRENPTWALSDKRLKAVLKHHGLQSSSQQPTVASKIESSLVPTEVMPVPDGIHVQMAKSKGRAVYASHGLESGAVVWEEDNVMLPIASLSVVPLMRKSLACAHCARTFQTRAKEDGTKCSHCEARWCSDECHKSDIIHASTWHDNVKKSKINQGKWQEYETLCLSNDWQNGFGAGVMLLSMLKDPSKAHELKTKLESLARIRQDVMEQMLHLEEDEATSSIRSQGYELLAEAIRPSKDLSLEEYMYALGAYNLNNYHGHIFCLQSHLNHSCEPNVRAELNIDGVTSTGVRIVALRDISAGEELVMSYLKHDEYQALGQRRQELRHGYGFICACDMCKREEQAVNEATQRTLEGKRDELAMFSDLQQKRPRRKSVRFNEQIEVA